MALPVWPTALPQVPLSSAWNNAPFRSPIATEMESGDVRVRRRPGMRLETVRWSQIMTRRQVDDVLMPFLRDTIADATGRFIMPVFLGGISCEVRVVQIVPADQPVSFSLSGSKVMVAFNLYVFPPSVTS